MSSRLGFLNTPPRSPERELGEDELPKTPSTPEEEKKHVKKEPDSGPRWRFPGEDPAVGNGTERPMTRGDAAAMLHEAYEHAFGGMRMLLDLTEEKMRIRDSSTPALPATTSSIPVVDSVTGVPSFPPIVVERGEDSEHKGEEKEGEGDEEKELHEIDSPDDFQEVIEEVKARMTNNQAENLSQYAFAMLYVVMKQGYRDPGFSPMEPQAVFRYVYEDWGEPEGGKQRFARFLRNVVGLAMHRDAVVVEDPEDDDPIVALSDIRVERPQDEHGEDLPPSGGPWEDTEEVRSGADEGDEGDVPDEAPSAGAAEPPPVEPPPTQTRVVPGLVPPPVPRFDARGRRGRRTALRIGDGGDWHQRAITRASALTKTLRDLLRRGQIDSSQYDGQPITPEQWNNPSTVSGAYLKGVIRRDRATEYQAHRRSEIRKRVYGGEDIATRSSKRTRQGTTENVTFIGGRGVLFDAPVFGDITTRDEFVDTFGKRKKPSLGEDGFLNPSLRKLFEPRTAKTMLPADISATDVKTITDTVTTACAWCLLYFANPWNSDRLVRGLAAVVFEMTYEDVVELLQNNASLIPDSQRALFEEPTFSLRALRQARGKKNRKTHGNINHFDPDVVKLAYMIVNGFIQLVIFDKIGELFAGMDEQKPAILTHAFLNDDLSKTRTLLNNFSLDDMEIDRIKQEIPTSVNENISQFIAQSHSKVVKEEGSETE